MELKERISILEALLLVSPKPLKINQVMEICQDGDQKGWEEALSFLEKHFNEEHNGIMLQRVATGIRLITKPQMEEYVKSFYQKNLKHNFSRAAFEVLAIIAYNQPITIPEINAIRGISSGGVIKTLLEKKMIKITGRKNVVGKPFLFGTTEEFLIRFGLNSLKDLPKIEEFNALEAE
jgi:segregation and condensation protein B